MKGGMGVVRMKRDWLLLVCWLLMCAAVVLGVLAGRYERGIPGGVQ